MYIHNVLVRFDGLDIKPVKFFGYRKARVNAFMNIGKWAEDNPDAREFMADLCKKLGHDLDNHIVVQCELGSSSDTVYFGYNDCVINVGLSIVEETW